MLELNPRNHQASHVEVGGGQERMEKVENGNGAGVPLRQGDHRLEGGVCQEPVEGDEGNVRPAPHVGVEEGEGDTECSSMAHHLPIVESGGLDVFVEDVFNLGITEDGHADS